MLRLKIISPEKIVYNGDAVSVKVPGIMGEFEILDNHAPLISALGDGPVEYVTPQGKNNIDARGGFVEVQKNEVNVCIEV
jgi:F-type H+-transporting ATPase subunit epsilon